MSGEEEWLLSFEGNGTHGVNTILYTDTQGIKAVQSDSYTSGHTIVLKSVTGLDELMYTCRVSIIKQTKEAKQMLKLKGKLVVEP